jgi:hypothetical protein
VQSWGGRQINGSDEQSINAQLPINTSRETDSQVIVESEEHFRKQ